jgi:hypothetical protein
MWSVRCRINSETKHPLNFMGLTAQGDASRKASAYTGQHFREVFVHKSTPLYALIIILEKSIEKEKCYSFTFILFTLYF